MVLIEDPARARRKARAIVSDVAIYNPEKIKEGITNDNIFEVLEEEIEEGRELYRTLVSPEILEKQNYYDLALVDVLIKQSGKVESNIW